MSSIPRDMFPAWFEATVRGARGADLIVSASQFAAPSAAEVHGIPCVGVSYSPLVFRSAHHPPIFVTRQGLPRWANAALWAFVDRAVLGAMRAPLNVKRWKLGLAPIRSTSQHLFENIPHLLACDEVVAPRPPDWSRYDVTTTGPWFYDDPAPLDPDVDSFLASGPAPVYVGFGNMVSGDAAALTRIILEGAGAQGRRVLMSKGWAGIGSAGLPPSVMVVHGPMPHAKLFPRVAAVVHHGGAGTMAAALRAAVPQVIVPHLADQFYHAHRLASLGIAPPGIRISNLTAERLGHAIDAALSLPEGPRQAAAERLRHGDGLARAVSAIERMETSRRSPRRSRDPG
jgi:UDP:flavonoid glycosyltransferase YjiC (YdhE family)